MNKKQVLIIAVIAIVAGFFAGVMVSGMSIERQAPQRGAPPAAAADAKEPVATAEEFKSPVIHYPDLPPVELVKRSDARLIAGEQSMISVLKMDKNSFFAPHRHKQEQIMIVLDG